MIPGFEHHFFGFTSWGHYNMGRNFMKNGIKTPAFWTGILTSIVVAMAADLGFEIDETTVAGLITAIITFIVTRIFKKKIENKKDQK